MEFDTYIDTYLNISFKVRSFHHSFKVYSSNIYVCVIYVYKCISTYVCDSLLTSMATSSYFSISINPEYKAEK